jgi:HSP20 family molecular chaperone IbpA
MTSFLDKLNGKLNGRRPGGAVRPMERLVSKTASATGATPKKEEELQATQSLSVDVYQGPNEIILYALAAGVDPEAFDLTLDEENDVLTIRGSRKRIESEKQLAELKGGDGTFLQQECSWEPFYRKVILPASVDVVRAEALFRKGVLVITLPILKTRDGRKLKVVEMLSAPKEAPKQ